MDEGTYWARVQRIFKMMDLRTAFVSDAQLQEAVDLLKAHAAGQEAAEEELERARHIKDAVLHPDTGEKIFLPLRLSFIVPCNLVLDVLMLSARGVTQNVGAQWLNQTYNSLHYYANRNATNAESTREIVEAYVGATASSVGAVLGLNSLLDRLPPSNKWAPVARRVVPFCGVAAADVLNLGITRRNEFLAGIRVCDANGDEIGRSKRAGAFAVSACIGGRIGAAAPILIIPNLIMHRLEQTRAYQRRPWLATPTLMGMVGFTIQACVPFIFGVFKQNAHVPSTWLEPEFHRWNKDGTPAHLFYNKGI